MRKLFKIAFYITFILILAYSIRATQLSIRYKMDLFNTDQSYSYLENLYKEERRISGTSINFQNRETKLIRLRKKDEKKLVDNNYKYTLLMMFSNMSCNTCVTSELDTFRDLNQTGLLKTSIRCISYSENIKYIKRFLTLNRLKVPVFIDKSQIITSQINTDRNLLVMLIDNETGGILNTYIPDQKYPKRSTEFRNYILRLEN